MKIIMLEMVIVKINYLFLLFNVSSTKNYSETQRNVVSCESFCQTFFKKFAEFEAEPQGF